MCSDAVRLELVIGTCHYQLSLIPSMILIIIQKMKMLILIERIRNQKVQHVDISD